MQPSLFYLLLFCAVQSTAQPVSYRNILNSWGKHVVFFSHFHSYSEGSSSWKIPDKGTSWWHLQDRTSSDFRVCCCCRGGGLLTLVSGRGHYVRSILLSSFLVRTLHCSPSSIPAVSSIWDSSGGLNLQLKQRFLDILLRKCNNPPSLLLHFPGSSIRPIILPLSFSLGECNTRSALKVIHQNILTFFFLCMYYMILLLMTDEYTELIFYFVTFHIYINISI